MSRLHTIRNRHKDTRSSQWALPISLSCARSSHGNAIYPSTSSTFVFFRSNLQIFRTSQLTFTLQAAPKSESHINPLKVSHHIHRIGYHFRCEIVEEACATLGYVPYDNTFITTADLQRRQQDTMVAKALAKHGVTWDRVSANEESPEQVRAAIKELFPRIPQNDLDEIVSRAWEKGENRVGNATDMPLARRVQLAVIARIRHTYTDYDALLGAFGDWAATRKEVEPSCLKKLIEWRGETGDDDEGLEEIVRETIVIDDDDDEDAPHADRGGDSSDTGDVSDSSIEISHRPAAMEDLRAEQAHDRDHRFFRRYAHPPRSQNQRNEAARGLISAYRSREHNAHASSYNQAVEYRPHPPANAQRIYVPSQGVADPPQHVVVDGRVMRLVRSKPSTEEFETNRRMLQVRDDAPQHHVNPVGSHVLHDRPVQSIERDDPARSAPQAYHSQPTAPQSARPRQPQNHFVDLTQDSPRYAQPQHEPMYRSHTTRQPVPQSHYGEEIVDLTSPRRQYDERPLPQPEVTRVVSSGDGRYVQAPVDQHGYARAPEGPHQAWRVEDRIPNGRYHDENAHEYDPSQPLLATRERGAYNTAPSSRYGSPAQGGLQQIRQAPVSHVHHLGQPPAQYTYPVAAPQPYQAAYQTHMAHSRSAPAPVHGAPAPVQQMPREYAPQPRRMINPRYDAVPVDSAADVYRQPAYAAPQHTQYHPR